jgi:hypothetical protein
MMMIYMVGVGVDDVIVLPTTVLVSLASFNAQSTSVTALCYNTFLLDSKKSVIQ